jgi:hypothetical protein
MVVISSPLLDSHPDCRYAAKAKLLASQKQYSRTTPVVDDALERRGSGFSELD